MKWGELPDHIVLAFQGTINIHRKLGEGSLEQRHVNWDKNPETRTAEACLSGHFGPLVCEKVVNFESSKNPIFMIGEDTDLLG